MNAGILFGKRTWVGCSISLALLVLLMLLGALLIVRGIFPTKMVSPWLWVSYGLAVFLGGRIAAVGQGRHMCAVIPGVMLYVLAWLLGLCSECPIDFSANGFGITIAVCLGTLAALACCRRKRSSRSRKTKRPTMRTVRR